MVDLRPGVWDNAKMIRMWCLSEAGEDNLGLACTKDGLLLGRTPLIERREHRFVVRDRSEIEALLSRAYRENVAADRLMSGLATVAAALNANDQCLARIAAVHLRLPDLADRAARGSMEADDFLIKSGDWNPALHPRAGAPPNPGWFATTEGAGDASPAMQIGQNDNPTERSGPQASGDESSSVRVAQNDDPTQRSDASPSVGDDWVRLPPGPQRIDELADFVEWIANAKPEDEQAIRAEIKRYFSDAGDQGSVNALNSALTVLLRPGITREDRQRILDGLDVFTRADPREYTQSRDWATGAALLGSGLPPIGAGETTAAESAVAEGAAAEAKPGAITSAAEAWKRGWAARGQYFDQLLRDGSLPPLFRTIDNFTKGVATSIKSIDLNAATYQNAARLTYRINQYVDELGDYEGGILSDTEVKSSAIADRVLNIVVPKNAMTEVQSAAVEAARARALVANRYPVKIVITPL
jgi:hypothetical protein